MFRIKQEAPEDIWEVEYLYDLAFAPGRTALSSYRLRDGVDPVPGLSLVVRDNYDVLAGAVRFWPVQIGEPGLPALLLGPVAVHPTHQGEGLGGSLIAGGLAQAKSTGWTRVILVGDEPYYLRFGFTRQAAKGLRMPPPTNPDRILGRELTPGAFTGVAGEVRRWSGVPPGEGQVGSRPAD